MRGGETLEKVQVTDCHMWEERMVCYTSVTTCIRIMRGGRTLENVLDTDIRCGIIEDSVFIIGFYKSDNNQFKHAETICRC